MADSTGVGFPSSGINKGHIFYNVRDLTLWEYLNGDPSIVSSWKLIAGTLYEQPATGLWGAEQSGARWELASAKTKYVWDGREIVPELNKSNYLKGNTVELIDDFIFGDTLSGSIGEFGWTKGGVGSYTIPGVPAANHPGYVRLDTTTTILTTARIFGNFNGGFAGSISSLRCKFVIRLNTVDGFEVVRLGLGSSWSSDPTFCIGFEKTDTIPDVNWIALTRNSTQTRSNTLVPILNDWTVLEFRATPTSVQFYVNGVLRVTNTTNIPTTGMTPGIQIRNLATESKTIDIDYFSLRYTTVR